MHSGDSGWQARDVDVEEKCRQDRSLWDAAVEACLPASFPVSGGKGKAAIATIPMIMRTLCLPGSNRSSLQVRLQCHMVS